jgi:acetyl esterase/lipase
MKILFSLIFVCLLTLTSHAQTNVVYGNASYNQLHYYNFYTGVPKPLLLIVPGSGFVSGGDPRLAFQTTAMYYANLGYVVAVMDYYRVAQPCANFPDVVKIAAADVHAALQALVANKDVLKINTNQIFVHGQSAGGIAANTAIWWSNAKMKSKFGNTYNKEMRSLYPGTSYTIKGLCLESTAIPYATVFTEADQNRDVPMIMYHSNRDHTVPFLTASPCTTADTLFGSGYIRRHIDLSPIRNNCYVMFEYNSTAHNLRSIISSSGMDNIVAQFFARVAGNVACGIVSPGPINVRVSDTDEEQYNLSETEQEESSSLIVNDRILALHFSDEQAEDITITLFDMTGHAALKRSMGTKRSLDLSELKQGVYIVWIEKENTMIKRKIVLY